MWKKMKGLNLIKYSLLIFLVFSYNNFIFSIENLSQQTLKSDIAYYHRISNKMNLSKNDRLHILYRILDKYKDTKIDTSQIIKEIELVKTGKFKVEKTTPKKQITKKKKTETLQKKVVKEEKKPQVQEPIQEKKKSIFPINLEGKTFEDDMSYYFDISEKEHLQDIEKLFILYRIRDKYKTSDVDLTILVDEILKYEDIVTQRLGTSIEGKTIDEDMFYYFRYSEEKKLNVNDKLFILYKIREKYEGQEVDKTVLEDEIKVNEAKWLKQKELEIEQTYITGISTKTLTDILITGTTTLPETITQSVRIIKQPDYLIQKGDILAIRVYPSNEISGERIVRPDGTINLPLVGTIIAENRTIGDLGEQIEKSLSRYIVAPEVTVNIRHSSENEILLTGEIRNPGVYSYKNKLKLLEVIAIAGGFTPSSKISEIKIYRGPRGNRNVLLINADEIIKSQDLSKDVFLERGDIIEVPRIVEKVSVIGAVNSPGSYEYKNGMKVFDAISYAGGPIKSSELKNVVVFRENKNEKERLNINVEEILKGKKTLDIELKPADIVFVPYKKSWWK